MSVYIFNKDKEKDLYWVVGHNKKKTLTVYEKFNANQIHNDTHLDEHLYNNNNNNNNNNVNIAE